MPYLYFLLHDDLSHPPLLLRDVFDDGRRVDGGGGRQGLLYRNRPLCWGRGNDRSNCRERDRGMERVID